MEVNEKVQSITSHSKKTLKNRNGQAKNNVSAVILPLNTMHAATSAACSKSLRADHSKKKKKKESWMERYSRLTTVAGKQRIRKAKENPSVLTLEEEALLYNITILLILPVL